MCVQPIRIDLKVSSVLQARAARTQQLMVASALHGHSAHLHRLRVEGYTTLHQPWCGLMLLLYSSAEQPSIGSYSPVTRALLMLLLERTSAQATPWLAGSRARALPQQCDLLACFDVQESVKGTARRVQMGLRGGGQPGPVDLNIPPGVDTGDTIEVQLAGTGQRRASMRVAIPIEVEPHPIFRCTRLRQRHGVGRRQTALREWG